MDNQKKESENSILSVNYSALEEEMQKYNPDYKRLSVKEIASSPEPYKLFATLLDDHFTILLRSADKKAVKKAEDYLKKEGFLVFGSQDTYGFENVKNNYLYVKKLPPQDVDMTMKKTASYLGLDLNKHEEIGKNKEGDYFFYFLPIKEKVRTWVDFKNGHYLDDLNDIAKSSHQSIDLIFAQLDNVVYGGLKLPGIASKDFYSAFFEAVNVQTVNEDKRSLYITCKVLEQLASNEKEAREKLGLFQLFLVKEPIFSLEPEETYLDFPNEVDESYLKS